MKQDSLTIQFYKAGEKPLFVYKSAYKYGSKGSNIALRGFVLRVSPTPTDSNTV